MQLRERPGRVARAGAAHAVVGPADAVRQTRAADRDHAASGDARQPRAAVLARSRCTLPGPCCNRCPHAVRGQRRAVALGGARGRRGELAPGGARPRMWLDAGHRRGVAAIRILGATQRGGREATGAVDAGWPRSRHRLVTRTRRSRCTPPRVQRRTSSRRTGRCTCTCRTVQSASLVQSNAAESALAGLARARRAGVRRRARRAARVAADTLLAGEGRHAAIRVHVAIGTGEAAAGDAGVGRRADAGPAGVGEPARAAGAAVDVLRARQADAIAARPRGARRRRWSSPSWWCCWWSSPPVATCRRVAMPPPAVPPRSAQAARAAARRSARPLRARDHPREREAQRNGPHRPATSQLVHAAAIATAARPRALTEFIRVAPWCRPRVTSRP